MRTLEEGDSGKERRIPVLDGLRAVSILLVLCSHVVYTHNFPLKDGLLITWLETLGPLGVRVFFVISGYLITSLLLKELRQTDTIRLSKFYFRRSLRIFVPYYFFLALMLGLNAFGGIHLTNQDIVHALSYTVNYYPQRAWEIGHAWSLSVEEQFYLIWPALLLFLRKRRALQLALVFFFLAPVIRIIYYYTIPSYVDYELGYRFETAADAIAVGCLMAGWLDWLNGRRLYQTLIHSHLVLLVIPVIFYVSLIDPHFKRYLILAIPVQNVGIGILILWCLNNPSRWAGKLLGSRLLVGIGRMSYSLYLWQQPFMQPYVTTTLTSFPVNLSLAFLAGALSFFLVEVPSYRIRKILEGKLFDRSIQGTIVVTGKPEE